MAIKELYIPADRGTMNPLVDNEPYSCDIDKIFNTLGYYIPGNTQGLISIERITDNLVLSEDPKNIPDNPVIFTPSDSDIVYCLMRITAYNKDKSKQWANSVMLRGWNGIPYLTPMPLVLSGEEKNVFANITPKPDMAKTLYVNANTKLEKYGSKKYRITLLDLTIRKAPFE